MNGDRQAVLLEVLMWLKYDKGWALAADAFQDRFGVEE